jgi:hypothetical protein
MHKNLKNLTWAVVVATTLIPVVGCGGAPDLTAPAASSPNLRDAPAAAANREGPDTVLTQACVKCGGKPQCTPTTWTEHQYVVVGPVVARVDSRQCSRDSFCRKTCGPWQPQ